MVRRARRPHNLVGGPAAHHAYSRNASVDLSMPNFRVAQTCLFGLALLAMAAVLGAFTTSQYVEHLSFDYLARGEQLQRHLAILQGHAGNPWQYRVLTAYLLKLIMQGCEFFGVAQPIVGAFIGFRVFQDSCIMLLAYAYYRRLGLATGQALLGMGVLAWSMSYSSHDSDLQFSTFFDVLFYLLAAWCILAERWVWLMPLTLLAALNRESSALIPLLLLGSALFAMEPGAWRRALPVVLVMLAIYVGVFVGLRALYGPQELTVAYGLRPGLALLRFNLLRTVTWSELAVTLGVVPFAAVYSYRAWPMQLRVFFWVLVPLWLLVHTLGAVLAEARLLLVPQALVFIPGALCTVGMAGSARLRRSRAR